MTIDKTAIQHLQKSANMLELEDKLQSKGTQSTLMLVPRSPIILGAVMTWIKSGISSSLTCKSFQEQIISHV